MLVTTTRFIDSLDSCMASKILVISIENGNLRIFYPAMSQVKPIIHPLFCELYPIGPLYSPSISRTNPINLWSCTPNHQGFYHLQYSNFFDISKISFYLPYWLMMSSLFFSAEILPTYDSMTLFLDLWCRRLWWWCRQKELLHNYHTLWMEKLCKKNRHQLQQPFTNTQFFASKNRRSP